VRRARKREAAPPLRIVRPTSAECRAKIDDAPVVVIYEAPGDDPVPVRPGDVRIPAQDGRGVFTFRRV
jgi:hypothetical protein